MRSIEESLGRVRDERNGPRTIDLDLILYGLQRIESHEAGLELIVPHPRMHLRSFVQPLAEIAPFRGSPRRRVMGPVQLLQSLENPEERKRA